MMWPNIIRAASLLLSGWALCISQLFKGGWIDPRSTFTCRALEIGRGTRINGPISIRGSEACSIGKYCSIGSNCAITTDNHDMRFANIQQSLHLKITGRPLADSGGSVVIGNNVWIGDGAIPLTGVSVGDGAVIAAGSITTKSVPAWSSVAGVPGRFQRNRFHQDICTQLDDIQWWNWPLSKIKRNRPFFEVDLTAESKKNLSAMIRD